MLILMLMIRIYLRVKSCNKSYDGCAMRVVFSCLRNCSGCKDDFRTDGREFQHIGPETAKAREPKDQRTKIMGGTCGVGTNTKLNIKRKAGQVLAFFAIKML